MIKLCNSLRPLPFPPKKREKDVSRNFMFVLTVELCMFRLSWNWLHWNYHSQLLSNGGHWEFGWIYCFLFGRVFNDREQEKVKIEKALPESCLASHWCFLFYAYMRNSFQNYNMVIFKRKILNVCRGRRVSP